MVKKFFIGLIYGVALSLPLPVVMASTPAAAMEAKSQLSPCCNNANPSCLCGAYDCCKTNCQKAKDGGNAACVGTNCTNACGAKYPS